jgi:hypothetical protein
VAEALPISVTAIIAIAGQAFIGVTTLRQTSVNFISPFFFFVLVMFWLGATINTVRGVVLTGLILLLVPRLGLIP